MQNRRRDRPTPVVVAAADSCERKTPGIHSRRRGIRGNRGMQKAGERGEREDQKHRFTEGPKHGAK
jgi:hypothetical protein